MKRTVYISGPMRGKPDLNRAAFEAAATRLRKKGFLVESPIEMEDREVERGMTPYLSLPMEHERRAHERKSLKRDLDVLFSGRIDEVYALSGWQQSRGALVEVDLARYLGIPVVHEDLDDREGKGEPTPALPDSGDRTQFRTGAVRDRRTGKGRFDLLPPRALLRLARHFEAGATKYEPRNWEKGIPLWCYLDSAMRHWTALMAGDRSEDHAAACVWNMVCFMETEAGVLTGRYGRELLADLPKDWPV